MRLINEFNQLLSSFTEQIASKFPEQINGQTKYEIAVLLEDVYKLGIEKGHYEALTNVISNAEKSKELHSDRTEDIFKKYA